MRRIAVVSVARSDYGIYRPLLRRIAASETLELMLVAGGMHLAPEFGNTVREIEGDGFPVAARVPMTPARDDPESIAQAMGLGTDRFARVYRELAPDLIVVLGDRYEMHAAAVAAVPFLIPIAHIAGGALSAGAIDDGFRHSMTKLAQVHFVETDVHRQRVVQMGEEPWRIHLTGALNLDNLQDFTPLPTAELKRRFGLAFDPADPPLLVTFHPVTREYEETGRYMSDLLAALGQCRDPVLFTHPNADTGGRAIIELIEAFVRETPRAASVPHLGTLGYFSLMHHSAAMVGNSSSGIIEAASFRLPVVNIGARQAGRLAPANVIHCPPERDGIARAIVRATSAEFRAGLQSLVNPYGDGRAAPRMVDVLESLDLDDPRLIQKQFYETDWITP
jgi:UDP-N-acetylglucosamine 2-epimerase (non-hydrolysing)/GDP/UDP-N,N'-diacetylbacillosamine 2-epimerase (hydrolysing)